MICEEVWSWKHQICLSFTACSMYKKIPPATETLRDSKPPAIGMLKSSQTCQHFSDRPLPSLPKTKHNGISLEEFANCCERTDTGFSSLLSGCPANIFIWNSVFRASRWFQVPDTIGSWKDAPREARSAFSLNGSQHPGSRKTPFCLAYPNMYQKTYLIYPNASSYFKKLQS